MTIKNNFFKAVAAAGVLASLVASPAFAGNDVCLPQDEAKISEVKGKGLDVFDFTKSSEACLKHYVSDISQSNLVLVARNNTVAWQNATVAAAKLIQSEARVKNKEASVFVAYFLDEDGLDTTAETVAWANGVQRRFAPVSIGGGHTIHELAAAPKKAIEFMKEVGADVWNKHLKPAVKK